MISDTDMERLKKELEQGIRFQVIGTEGVMAEEQQRERPNYVEFHLTVKHEEDDNEVVTFHSEEELRKAVGDLIADGYRLEELELEVKHGVLKYTSEYRADLTRYL